MRFLYILILVLFIPACGKESPSAVARKPVESARKLPTVDLEIASEKVESKQTPYKITLLVPTEGEARKIGEAMIHSSILALSDMADDENAKRFVIMPKSANNNSDLTQNILEASKQGSQLILGPIFSQNLETAIPVAAKEGMTIMSFSNNRKLASPNTFILGFSPDEQIKRVVSYAISKGYRKFAALLPDDAYGKIVEKAMNEALAENSETSELSAKIQFYPQAAASLKIEIDKLFASKDFDALLIPEGGDRLKGIASLLEQRDITGIRILGSGQWDGNKNLSSSLNGAWYASGNIERRKSFERHFMQHFGYSPPRIASLSYDIISALVSINGFDAYKITEDKGFDGKVDGKFRVRPDGIVERELVVIETQQGSERIIAE